MNGKVTPIAINGGKKPIVHKNWWENFIKKNHYALQLFNDISLKLK